LAEVLIEEKNFEKALVLLNELLKEAVSPQRTKKLTLLKFEALLGAKNKNEIERWGKDVLLNLKSREEFDAYAPTLEKIKEKLGTDLLSWSQQDVQQYLIAESFEKNSQWHDAIDVLRPLLNREQLSREVRAKSMWILGLSLARIHQYDEAVTLLEDTRKLPESSPFRGNLLRRLALTYAKRGEFETSLRIRRNLLESHPSKKSKQQLAQIIADTEFYQGSYRQAIAAWKTSLELGLRGKQKAVTNWHLAWSYYRLGKYDEALERFSQLIESKEAKIYHMHDRVRYWKARTFEQLSQHDEARKIYRELMREYPVGYYREAARRRLEKKELDFSTIAHTKLKKINEIHWEPELPDFRLLEKSSPHFSRALYLHRFPFHEELIEELKASKEEKGYLEIKLWLAAQHEGHSFAYRFVARHFKHYFSRLPENDAFGQFVWKQYYPEVYPDIVSQVINNGDLDKRLIYALIRTESAFQEKVVSKAGAIGLMQIMPTTAKQVAIMESEGGAFSFESSQLYEAKHNIHLGIGYFTYLQSLFPNNPVAWIASYNAGEDAVARWLKQKKDLTIEEFIEEIPYYETNLYVKKVLTAYWVNQLLH